MEVSKNRLGASIVCTAMLAAAFVGNSAAASPAVCDRRLSVELTPDVPNPRDPGFLSSLLSNQVTIHRDQESLPEIAAPQVANSTTAMRTVPAGARRTTLDLRPPDLQSLHVKTLQPAATTSEFDETEAVNIAAAPLRPGENPDIKLPPAGIGSLYWAVRHPTRAWRILLPVQLDGDEVDIERHERAARRAPPETLIERRDIDISANPAPARLAHDTRGNSVRRAQSGEAT
jgi:hypothetical protein